MHYEFVDYYAVIYVSPLDNPAGSPELTLLHPPAQRGRDLLPHLALLPLEDDAGVLLGGTGRQGPTLPTWACLPGQTVT